MKKEIVKKILLSWFDRGMYLTQTADEYGKTRYVGFHGGRTSEVVCEEKRPDTLRIYQIDNGGSYLNAFAFERQDDPIRHEKNMRIIGMAGSGMDFSFETVRNYSECHTDVTLLASNGKSDEEELNRRTDRLQGILSEEEGRHPGFVGRYAACRITWKDNGGTEDVIVKLSSDYENHDDDHIFYYMDSLRDLASLTMSGKEDFVVDIDSISFFEKL